jgi:hypothetical protein
MKPIPNQLLGKWVHTLPWDSDDYLSEYDISLKNGKLSVSGVDLNDNEKFKISKISWDGKCLRFTSFMPSTRRVGLNELRIKKNGRMESRFTFTVIEEMVRPKTQPDAAVKARLRGRRRPS